jgi:hypothetical protein
VEKLAEAEKMEREDVLCDWKGLEIAWERGEEKG